MADPSDFQIRQCTRAECGLRYPEVEGHSYGIRCPRCGAATRLVLSKPLEREPVPWVHPAAGVHLDALLDNIRSAWNVGSMFRTADGLGICQLYLCGITPSPNNPKVLKTSLGAERNVVWTSEQDGVKVAQTLLERGRHLWALEQEARAVPLLEIERQALPQSLVLVVGNEIGGVDPGILELCEQVVSIPMLGAKRSLNAAVAFGITVHYLNSLSK